MVDVRVQRFGAAKGLDLDGLPCFEGGLRVNFARRLGGVVCMGEWRLSVDSSSSARVSGDSSLASGTQYLGRTDWEGAEVLSEGGSGEGEYRNLRKRASSSLSLSSESTTSGKVQVRSSELVCEYAIGKAVGACSLWFIEGKYKAASASLDAPSPSCPVAVGGGNFRHSAGRAGDRPGS